MSSGCPDAGRRASPGQAAAQLRSVLAVAILLRHGFADQCRASCRVCADPNNLPFSNQRRRASRTRSSTLSPRSSCGRVATSGGRSGAASSATR